MYDVVSYYKFITLETPKEWVRKHKAFFKEKDVKGRIYISVQGINGQISAPPAAMEEYKSWLVSHEEFADLLFKTQKHERHAFDRMTVKEREQLAALDYEVDLAKGGEHVSPKKWREMMESDEDYLLIDVRNDYETAVGHFKGSELPDCETFREFPDYCDRLKDRVDPEKTKIMMCCTGGIRCELYSALMKDKGFKDVYQLDGGIITYGKEEGNAHWDGKLFVFDDRMVVPISEDEHSTIGSCDHCGAPADHYYNCANMDCNNLFVACDKCLDERKGTCQEAACMESERLRSYSEEMRHHPFRRKNQYKKL